MEREKKVKREGAGRRGAHLKGKSKVERGLSSLFLFKVFYVLNFLSSSNEFISGT
jgi:hypothetical protein